MRPCKSLRWFKKKKKSAISFFFTPSSGSQLTNPDESFFGFEEDFRNRFPTLEWSCMLRAWSPSLPRKQFNMSLFGHHVPNEQKVQTGEVKKTFDPNVMVYEICFRLGATFKGLTKSPIASQNHDLFSPITLHIQKNRNPKKKSLNNFWFKRDNSEERK